MKYYRINKLKRYLVLLIITFGCFFALVIRLSYVKIIKGQEYYERALKLWTREAPVEGSRGNIYDRNGKLIVGSYLTPTVVVIPRQIKNPLDAAKKLSQVTRVNYKTILKHLTKKVSVEILKPELKDISYKMATDIVKLNIDGVYVVADTSRYYPYGNLLAPVIGITGIDNQGITGIEYIYNQNLSPKNGALKIYTDAHGNLMDNLTSYYDPANKGDDVYLTIDLDLQIIIENILDNAVSRYNPTSVWALALNPKTSEVLAMAQRPTFDLENYQDYDQSVYNQNIPIWKSYEPGSVFKILTFSAGIEEKAFKLDEQFFDPGYLIVDGVRIKDWKAGGHGKETFLEVLQNSCNPGFMTIGLRLGKDKLFKYINRYGYGKKTGIDLLGESSGIVFDKSIVGNVELATSSFGQGNSATTIQLVNASCAAVNGGILHQPYILSKIVNNNTLIKENKPVQIRRVISEETSNTMKYALECVAALGTARGSHIAGYRVGGKTGVLLC